MANLKYSDKHNMVAFLKKPNESVGFTEVVDFLKGTSLRYALTHNPTIYDSLVKQFWQTATVRTLANGTQQLVASIDSKEYTITEASVRSKLQLADATGIHNLSDAEIYVGLATLGYVTEGDFVPLLPAMLAGAVVDQGEGSTQPAEPHHTPVDPIPSTSQPPSQSPPHSPLQSLPHSPLQSPHQSPPYSPPHYSPPRIETLETELQQTKTTYGKAVLTLVKRVKILKKALKRKTQRVVISESEGEEPEDHGRIIQDIDDDPLVSLVRESMRMNEKSTDFVTPTKASGEAQEEETSPTILEAAKTLSKVASQSVSKAKSTDKGKRYRRGARSMAKKINTELDADDEINTSRVEINSGIEDVNTGSSKVDTEDIQATYKTKEQIRQEEAGLKEAIRLQAQMDKEVSKQIHLDKMLAKRVQEEQELAKLKANTEAVKSLQGESKSNDDFAKRMMEMINEKKKFYAEQKAKAKKKSFLLKKQETSKKQKIEIEDASITKGKDEVIKEEEAKVPVKKTEMRRKQKGINIDKTAQDEFNKEREAYVEDKVKDASSKSNDYGVDAILHCVKPPIYFILKDFSRDELVELYRLVIKKYKENRPEEMYDRVLWGDLKTMFDPPLSDDAIWSLPLQQKIINWRDAKDEALRWTMDEVCYQLLKMIEKQAGIRKR
ncbi:hypothetical protein Tco_1516729 [Tanacetum coccineum]